MITLPIKKHWFDMILSGEKKEEYRSLTKRYESMFKNAANEKNQFWCIIRNGYSSNSPSAKLFVEYHVGYGNPNWGAEPNQLYFVLSILDIEK